MFESIDVKRMSRDFQKEPWKKRKDVPVESDFRYLYEELNLIGEEICAYMGISQPTLSRAIRQFKLHKTKERKKEARINTFIKKFGSPSPLGNKEIRARRDATCIELYGDVNPIKNKLIADKRNKTTNERYGGNSPMCSKKVQDKSKKTNLEKRGVENVSQSEDIKQQIKRTNLEKRGVENVFQAADVKEKIKQTNLKVYGKEYASQADVVKEKIKQANLKAYKTENVFQAEEIKSKIRQYNKENFGVDYASQKHIKNLENLNKEYWETHFISKHGKFCVSECAAYHNLAPVTVRDYKRKFGIKFPNKYESVNEVDIVRYCGSLGFTARKDRTVLGGREIDIYIPDKNLGIEHDGLMFHASNIPNVLSKVNRFYDEKHFDKTFDCWKSGITLLHIFDYEWNDLTMRNVWRGIIKEKLQITKPLHDIVMSEVTNSIANKFFDKYTLYHENAGTFNYLLKQGSRPIACLRLSTVNNTLTITDVGVVSGYSRVDVINFIMNKIDADVNIQIDNRMYNIDEFSNYNIVQFIPPKFIYAKLEDILAHRIQNIKRGSGDYSKLTAEDYIVVHDSGYTILSK